MDFLYRYHRFILITLYALPKTAIEKTYGEPHSDFPVVSSVLITLYALPKTAIEKTYGEPHSDFPVVSSVTTNPLLLG